MVTDPTIRSAEDAALDFSSRLASGIAHELNGLLFAMRMRVEAVTLGSGPVDRGDADALEAGLRELQSVVDAVRLLGARKGTGTLVRARAVDTAAWWQRTERLARYVLPRGATVTGEAIAGVGLERVDLRRLTEAVLLLIAHAAHESADASIAVTVRLTPRADRIAFTVSPDRRDAARPAIGAGPLLTRARRLIRTEGGSIRRRGPADSESLELVVPRPAAAP